MSNAIHHTLPKSFIAIFVVPSRRPKAFYHLVYLAYTLALYISVLLMSVVAIVYMSIFVSDYEVALVGKVYWMATSALVLTVMFCRLVNKSPSYRVWCNWMVGIFFQLTPLLHFCAILTQLLFEFARGI